MISISGSSASTPEISAPTCTKSPLLPAALIPVSSNSALPWSRVPRLHRSALPSPEISETGSTPSTRHTSGRTVKSPFRTVKFTVTLSTGSLPGAGASSLMLYRHTETMLSPVTTVVGVPDCHSPVSSYTVAASAGGVWTHPRLPASATASSPAPKRRQPFCLRGGSSLPRSMLMLLNMLMLLSVVFRGHPVTLPSHFRAPGQRWCRAHSGRHACKCLCARYLGEQVASLIHPTASSEMPGTAD
ncbi:hypothetical protein U746_2804 [Mycolicibacterium mucogenicum 261Sha1.1M5]|nr:hypothetical protein U746_2804 [Mycolicibacterium mucogenicum 261Sha1.1M5]